MMRRSHGGRVVGGLLLLLLHGLGGPGMCARPPVLQRQPRVLMGMGCVRTAARCSPDGDAPRLRLYPGAGRDEFEAQHGEALAVEFEILFFDPLLRSAALLLLVDGHVVHRSSQVAPETPGGTSDCL